MTISKFVLNTLFKLLAALMFFNMFVIANKGMEALKATRHDQVTPTAIPTNLTELAPPGPPAQGMAIQDEGEYWTVHIKKPKNATDLNTISSSLIGLTQ